MFPILLIELNILHFHDENLKIKIQIFTFSALDFFGLVITERLQYSTFS